MTKKSKDLLTQQKPEEEKANSNLLKENTLTNSIQKSETDLENVEVKWDDNPKEPSRIMIQIGTIKRIKMEMPDKTLLIIEPEGKIKLEQGFYILGSFNKVIKDYKVGDKVAINFNIYSEVSISANDEVELHYALYVVDIKVLNPKGEDYSINNIQNKLNDIKILTKDINDSLTHESAKEEGNKNLLFGDKFLNQWYRGKETHVSPYRYYVVFKGHQPGIYDNWPDAQEQIVGFSKCKQKSFDGLGDAATALREYLEKQAEGTAHLEIVSVENSNEYTIAKKNWHDRIKKHTAQFYNHHGSLHPMIFFLIKEGDKYQEKLVLVPLEDAGDREMIAAFLKKMCSDHKVVSYCTAFEAWTLEASKRGDLEASISQHPDRKEIIIMTCESLEEKIMTTFELKDGKVSSSKEVVQKINSDYVSYDLLCNVLFSGEKSVKATK